ncbi:MAG TPA: hypothetical protein VIM59_18120 [Cellvibrio sp.]
MENYVSELRGYLQSLRRLCRRQCDFHVESFLVENDIHASIEEYINKLGAEFKFNGIKPITYQEVETVIKKHLILELEVENQNTIELFLWDIVEYYGLASTASNPNGDFNPLVSNGALAVDVESSHYSSGTIFVVVIEKTAVITWLSVRT